MVKTKFIVITNSKILSKSYIGDHDWFMTSKQILPDVSSTLGWYILFRNPILGDL